MLCGSVALAVVVWYDCDIGSGSCGGSGAWPSILASVPVKMLFSLRVLRPRRSSRVESESVRGFSIASERRKSVRQIFWFCGAIAADEIGWEIIDRRRRERQRAKRRPIRRPSMRPGKKAARRAGVGYATHDGLGLQTAEHRAGLAVLVDRGPLGVESVAVLVGELVTVRAGLDASGLLKLLPALMGERSATQAEDLQL